MSLDDLMQQLGEADIPEGWRPQEGDKLIGKVLQVITDAWSDQSQSEYPIIVIHDEEKDEDISCHCFHHVLKKEIIKYKPQVGERIAIQYNGEQPLKGNPNRSVKLYRVVVEGRKADYGNLSQQTPNKEDQATGQEAATEDTPF